MLVKDGVQTKNDLRLHIEVKDQSWLEQPNRDLILFSAETSRYFNAKDFEAKGFQDFSTITA